MLNVTFQQLEIFQAVAERLNMTETADSLFISQSALSKIISRLENNLGLRLFSREGRRLALTKEGQYLYNAIKNPYKSIVSAVSTAQLMQSQTRKALHIACPGTYDYNTDYNVIKQTIAKYRAENPDVEVTESIYESPMQRDALLYSEVDISISQGFVVEPLENVSSMKIRPLDTYFAMSSAHRLASLSELPVNELAHETLYAVLITNDRQQLEARTMSLCKAAGFIPKEIKCVPNMPTLIHVLAQGAGVAICGKIDITASDVPVKYFPYPASPGSVQQYIVAAWRTGDVSFEARRLLALLSECAEPERGARQ